MSEELPSRRMPVLVVLVTALLCGACTKGPPPPDETIPPTRTSPTSTLALAKVGDALTVTASVESVITTTAIVVRDVDLTDGSLLVLGVDAGVLTPPQLVQVEGRVIRFSHRELAGTYRLGDRSAYLRFEGQKAVAAERVTAWD